MSKFAKHSAQLASGIGLVALSKGMGRAQQSMKEQIEFAQSHPAPPVPKVYEYIFYERAVKEVLTVVDEITEIILANGYPVDPQLLGRAKIIIDIMTQALAEVVE